MPEMHKPFRPTEPSPNRKGANVVSRYFRIGKSKAQVKKKERRSTHDHKAARHIQLREQWQLLITVAPRLAAKKSVRKARFRKPSVKASGRNRKVYRN